MRLFLLLASLLMFVTTPACAGSALEDYLELRLGSFTSADQAAVDDRFDEAIWHITQIWQESDERAGDDNPQAWTYLEAWLAGADKPYLQRLSSVIEQPDGTLSSTSFRIEQPAPFIGLHTGKPVPEQAGTGLININGCTSTIVRTGHMRFEGSTQGKRCGNEYKGASYAISHSTLFEGGMSNWDRGFAASGEQVWGPASGGYRFTRVGNAGQCSKPVRMLVYGEIFDRARFGAYVGALAKAEIYPEHGGYYEAISPVLDTFEGEPPKNRGVVIARFPCLLAAQRFWQSDAYQAIKPLREGAAEFEVIVLPAPPLPTYLDDLTPW